MGTLTRVRIGLVVNPTAGKGSGGHLAAKIADLARGRGADLIDLSADSAQAAHAAAADRLQDLDALFVAGGDGMAHLGVSVCATTPVPLALIPTGTGNDSAAAHGVPADPLAATRQALDLLVEGRSRATDLARVRCGDGSQHWFLSVLSLGFDAIVNERANRMRWPKGPSRYNVAVARELPVFRPPRYEITLDGKHLSTAAMLVSIANGPRFGGGMQIAPQARTDDGLLDVVVLAPVPIPRFVRFFPSVFQGTHVDRDEVRILRTRVVEVSLDRAITAYADGEPIGPAPVRCEAVEGALQLLA